MSATADHVILDMTSEDESSDWEEDLAGRRYAQIGQIGMPRRAVYLDLSDPSPAVASCR